MWRIQGWLLNERLSSTIIFSRLVLWEGSKSSLPGVWDPCPGEPDKWLLVQYTYKGAQHQLLCPDLEAVKLPKTSHKISPAADKSPPPLVYD